MSLDRATIVSLGSKLAPAAAAFGRLQTLLEDPMTGTDEIVQLIRLDPALSFHVIRMSNSVIFGIREPNDTLEDAVGRVGFREIYRLVGLAATHQTCQSDLPCYRLKASRLWENAVATAAAAEVLASPGGADPGLAYTSGLLRTLGRVIINGVAGNQVYPGEAEWPLVAEWEQITFGVTAAEVTAMLLEHWRFPAQIVDAVRHHFDPFGRPEPNVGACVLNLACGVVARFGVDLPGETSHWIGSPTELRLANVPQSVLEECAFRAREHYSALCASVV
ncbi:HDOD domain-containing protein [Opitutus terrae]|uniref:Putative signal transduction protein n=1 Tax=Opitutus terrae (strain DSM 11246 / JCM 15787 / PB90-1) TaxID=452637 RepID=B1ZUG2_OPITP|nr:HDOD domain-containing protein [Opitutus terrae]ACB74005.1 putative signal transduction protein [Opitutus terrae PB90-1]